jgi:hypothetical protein
MYEIIDISQTCTGIYGEPTGNILEGEGYVEIIDHEITLFAQARCLTHPLSDPVGPFPVTYTYDSVNDTLTDDLGTNWYRK